MSLLPFCLDPTTERAFSKNNQEPYSSYPFIDYDNQCRLKISETLLITFYIQAGLFLIIFIIFACRSSPAEASLKMRSYSEEHIDIEPGSAARSTLMNPLNTIDEIERRSSQASTEDFKMRNKLRNSARMARQSLESTDNRQFLKELSSRSSQKKLKDNVSQSKKNGGGKQRNNLHPN